MKYIEYAKHRYDSAIQEIERLKQSEFPYPQIREALLQLETLFRAKRSDLDRLSPLSTPAVAKNLCSQSLSFLFIYTPFLGFILRATNIRNAFELYAPVMRLSRVLLGDTTKLLLSSEWDYSPFVYLPTDDLPDCVLIGIPAFESSNPLLISLAGHELGHNLWSQNKVGNKIDGELRDEILNAIKGPYWGEFQLYSPNATHANLTTDMFVQQAWSPAYAFAKRQLEEIFCDVMGVRLFAEAYLHAFAYLLSPCIPGERTPIYPSIRDRVAYVLRASTDLMVSPPSGYADLFDSESKPTNPVTMMLTNVADVAVGRLFDRILSEAKTIADGKVAPFRDHAKIDSIIHDLKMVMPADGNAQLVDLINAGWVLFHDDDLWNDVPQIRKEERVPILHDLILKSCEVSEFSVRTS